jgi:hypothetical protein
MSRGWNKSGRRVYTTISTTANHGLEDGWEGITR